MAGGHQAKWPTLNAWIVAARGCQPGNPRDASNRIIPASMLTRGDQLMLAGMIYARAPSHAGYWTEVAQLPQSGLVALE